MPHSHLEAGEPRPRAWWLAEDPKRGRAFLSPGLPPHPENPEPGTPVPLPPASLTGTPSWRDPGWVQETRRPIRGDPQSLRTDVLTALRLTSSSDVEALEGFLSSDARSCRCRNEAGHFSPGTPLPPFTLYSPPPSLNTFIHNPWTSLPKELSLPPDTSFLRGPGCRRLPDPCPRDPPSPPCPPGRVKSSPTHVARPESRLRGSAQGPQPQQGLMCTDSYHGPRLQEPRGRIRGSHWSSWFTPGEPRWPHRGSLRGPVGGALGTAEGCTAWPLAHVVGSAFP